MRRPLLSLMTCLFAVLLILPYALAAPSPP